METTIAQRIRKVFQAKHLNATSFADIAGMQPVTVNRQLKGANPIGFNLIDAILQQFPDVSAEWLLRGAGEMIIGQEPTQKTDFVDIFLKGICNSNSEELDEFQKALTSVKKLRNMNHTN